MSADGTADALDQQTDRPSLGRRRPLVGAAVGTFIEFYDFAVYALTVPIVAASFFPDGDPAVALISAFAVYGVAFIVRPLGGVVFGAIGDRFGRRRVLMLVLTLIGVATALIGVLPTYEQVGLLAPLLLVALRVAQGLSAGGEVTSATSFALEHAPGHRRSTWITTVVAMSAVSSIVGLLVVLGLSAVLPEAAFAAWGWRLPFLLALPLSLVGLYIRLRTDESPAFEKAQRRKALSATPVREALTRNGRAVFAAFALAAMSALAFYFLVGYFPTYLQVNAGLSRPAALVTNGLALVGFTAGLIVAGSVADRVGRLPMIRIGAALLVVASPPAFLLAGSGSPTAAVAGQLLLAAALCVFGGGSYAMLLEAFPTRTRLSGAALGYNAGYALFGGTAPLLGSVLVTWTGSQYAPGYYLAVVALLVLFCTFSLPETKEVDIHA